LILEFKKLTLDHIEKFRPFFKDNNCRICDCTVGGTFMWRDHHYTEYALEDEALYLKVTYPETGPAFAPPMGARSDKAAYQRVIEYCDENNMPVKICAVTEAVKKDIDQMFPGSTSWTDRAWSDYLYLSDDIKNLAGRKFSGQRNHINRFKKENPSWEFRPVTADNLAEATEFIENYAREHVKKYAAYDEGNIKTLEVLSNFELYGQIGGVLYVTGKPIGLSLGETVGDTLFVHVEKADTSHHGSYPMLMNQFANMFVQDGISYINREEDDGVEGLRVSKLSYHPIDILDKYIVEIQ